MINICQWSTLNGAGREGALTRPVNQKDSSINDTVANIFDNVRAGGWTELHAISGRLDGSPVRYLQLTSELINQARQAVSDEDFAALQLAAKNIEAFHRAACPDAVTVQTMPGVSCTRKFVPLQTAGLYVPGGSAPLFSTLLMLAIPAKIAGVVNRIVCTPPDRTSGDGLPHPMMILAASLCQIDGLWLVGGAQAIAAMSFGLPALDDIPAFPRADKIFGPGNAWVDAAKQLAASIPGGPAIDLPAGPSELMIVADDSADPEIVATDLLSQAEHDPLAQVVLLSVDQSLTEAVSHQLECITPSLPRSEIAAKALANSVIINVDSLEIAAGIANQYAPEHLSLNCQAADELVDQIHNAGAIFVGQNSSEVFGDYIAGPNHVLPTSAAARAYSGVGTESFMHAVTIQHVSQNGAADLAAPAARLARMEGLEAHARSADLRARNAGDI